MFNLYLDHLKLIGIVSIQVTLNHFGSVDTYALPLDIVLDTLGKNREEEEENTITFRLKCIVIA